ncbi:unnamed protein product [Debaryomyces tyrocola]|nr:unnamed protein product [Debaryomyces tyrocola]
MSDLKINEPLDFKLLKDHSTTETDMTDNISSNNHLIALEVNKGNIMHHKYNYKSGDTDDMDFLQFLQR